MKADRARPALDLQILLLPGLDGTGRLFAPLVDSAPPGFSPRPIRYPATISSYQALAPIVRAQQPEGPWICVAESFSGPLAVQLAAARPPGLQAVVLVATAARWSRHQWLRFTPPAIFWPLPGRSVVVRSLLLGWSAPPGLVRAWKEAVAEVAPGILAARLRAFARADVTEALRQVDVPILYIQAGADRLMRNPERESVLRARPDIESCRIDGPHFLLQTRPEASWEEIRRFVGSCRLS